MRHRVTLPSATDLLGWPLTLAVAAAPVILSLLVVPVARDFTWDEAVYWARAAGHEDWRNLWGPSRSLGIPVLISPVALMTDSAIAIRLWSSMVAVGVSFMCLRLWLPVAGRAILVSWLLLCTTWTFVWYSTEWYPNWYIGVVFASLLGWSARVRAGLRAPAVLGCVLGLAAVLIRPTDAMILIGGAGMVAVALVAFDHNRNWHRAVTQLRLHWPVGAGVVIGLAVFGTESTLQFGGVLQRLQSASPARSPEIPSAATYIGALVNPTSGLPVSSLRVGILMVHVVVLVGLAAAGMIAASRADRRLFLPALGAAAAITVVYLAPDLDTPMLGRFLIPSVVMLALMSTPLWSRLFRSAAHKPSLPLTAGIAVLAVTLGALTVLNSQLILERFERQGLRDGPRQSAQILDDIAAGQDCVFGAQFGRPQLLIHTQCAGRSLRFDSVPPESAKFLRDAPVAFLVGPIAPGEGWLAAGWEPVDSAGGPTIWLRRQGTGADGGR